LRQDRDDCFSKAEKYLEELYACGGRVRPATVEQQAKEQAQINKEIFSALKDLSSEIKLIRFGQNLTAPAEVKNGNA
jgi:hypothetical protein